MGVWGFMDSATPLRFAQNDEAGFFFALSCEIRFSDS